MADKRISDLDPLAGLDINIADIFPIIDKDDFSQSPTGTTKKVTLGALEIALSRLSAHRLFDYSIYFEGAVYKAKNTNTGFISQENSEFHTLIQAIMDTNPSRTKAVKIAISGDITAESVSSVPDHTHLQIFGDIVLDADVVAVFRNSQQTTGNTNIRVQGTGSISGGVPTGSNFTRNPLNFKKVSKLVIEGIEVKDAGSHCISITDCPDVKLQMVLAHNAGDDCISVLECEGFDVSFNEVHTTREDFPISNPTVGSSGIEIEDGSKDGTAHKNYIHDCHVGLHCILDPQGPSDGSMNHLKLTENTIKNVTGTGLDVISNQDDDNVINSMILISKNMISITGGKGIGITRVYDCTLSDNILDDIDGDAFNIARCRRVKANGNTIRNCTGHGFSLFGSLAEEDEICEDISIISNSCYNIGTNATKVEAVKGNGVGDINIEHLTAVDDRGLAGTGLSYGISLFNCYGDCSATFTTIKGHNNSVSISKGGTTPEILGRTGDNFAVTNKSVQAV